MKFLNSGNSQSLDFSNANISRLSDAVNDLLNVLRELGYNYSPALSNVLHAATVRDEMLFKKCVLINDIWGGSGALWEIDIRQPEQRTRFTNSFRKFADVIVAIGITDGRVKQIRDDFT